MVVKIAAYAGQIEHGLDTGRLQLRCRADAGQQQELRRLQCAGAQDHFAPGPHLVLPAFALVHHAHRAPTLDDDAQRQRVRVQSDVAAAQRGAQETRGPWFHACRPESFLGESPLPRNRHR